MIKSWRGETESKIKAGIKDNKIKENLKKKERRKINNLKINKTEIRKKLEKDKK